jgi:hypothetical protein
MFRDPIAAPTWLPPTVAQELRRLESNELTDAQHAQLRRLATNENMRAVWTRLNSRNRNGGGCMYPAAVRRPEDAFGPSCFGALTSEKLQDMALGRFFYLSFRAANDKLATAKWEDVEQIIETYRSRATVLRNTAAHLVAAFRGNILKASVLLEVAEWYDIQITETRKPDDPLVIKRHRGDPVVRGVQTIISMHLQEIFGKRFDGIAATVTAVALGRPTTPRASRSALSRPNRKIKAAR